MDDRVSKDIFDSLDIDHNHVASGILPRKVAQSLGDKSLISIRLVHPPSIVILLYVISFDVVLCVPVLDCLIFEGISILIFLEPFFVLLAFNNLVNERSDEIPEEIWLRNTIDNSLVERVDN